jgi:hypothetical protein
MCIDVQIIKGNIVDIMFYERHFLCTSRKTPMEAQVHKLFAFMQR